MAINYNAGTNTITVTGYTEATPCTFLDIFNADIAGGWGVSHRQCNKQYCFDAFIIIGDGSTVTWFADNYVSVLWSNFFSAHWQIALRGRTNSHIKIEHASIASQTSAFAIYLIAGTSVEYAPDVKINYCSTIQMDPSYQPSPLIYISGGYIKNTNCSYTTPKFLQNMTLSQINSFGRFGADYGLQNLVNCNVSDVYLKNGYASIFVSGSAVSNTFKNIIAKTPSNFDLRLYTLYYPQYFINCIFEQNNWRLAWLDTSSSCIYRQYEFDLKVQDKDENDINAATVKIWDLNNNLVVNTATNASGVIATQTLNYGYYTQAGGDTPTMQTPHTIQISKAGYETYSKKWTLDKKTDWTIALHIPKRRFDSLEG